MTSSRRIPDNFDDLKAWIFNELNMQPLSQTFCICLTAPKFILKVNIEAAHLFTLVRVKTNNLEISKFIQKVYLDGICDYVFQRSSIINTVRRFKYVHVPSRFNINLKPTFWHYIKSKSNASLCAQNMCSFCNMDRLQLYINALAEKAIIYCGSKVFR